MLGKDAADVSFVKSVNCCDELGVEGCWRREESGLPWQRTAPHALQSQLESTCWGLKREEERGGALPVTRRHASWIQQAEPAAEGCLSRKDWQEQHPQGRLEEAEELPPR